MRGVHCGGLCRWVDPRLRRPLRDTGDRGGRRLAHLDLEGGQRELEVEQSRDCEKQRNGDEHRGLELEHDGIRFEHLLEHDEHDEHDEHGDHDECDEHDERTQ